MANEDDNLREIAHAIRDGLYRNEDGDDLSVVDALYAIARSLDRIGAALDGPWPSALADAFYLKGIGRP